MIVNDLGTIRAYFSLARSGRHIRGRSPLLRHRILWPFGETGAIFFP